MRQLRLSAVRQGSEERHQDHEIIDDLLGDVAFAFRRLPVPLRHQDRIRQGHLHQAPEELEVSHPTVGATDDEGDDRHQRKPGQEPLDLMAAGGHRERFQDVELLVGGKMCRLGLGRTQQQRPGQTRQGDADSKKQPSRQTKPGQVQRHLASSDTSISRCEVLSGGELY